MQQENKVEDSSLQESFEIQQSPPMVNGLISDEEPLSSTTSQSPPTKENTNAPPPAMATLSPAAIAASPQCPPSPPLNKPYEEDTLEHMQSVTSDLVAKLVEDDDPSSSSRIHAPPPPGGFLPAESLQSSEEQWFYTDPQVNDQAGVYILHFCIFFK